MAGRGPSRCFLLPDFDPLTIIHRLNSRVSAMDKAPTSASAGPMRLLLMPHRSLTRAGFWLFLAAQSVAAGGFAGLAAWRGNVFAPAFAVLELGIVAYCLARVRRASANGEIIMLTPTALEVTRMGRAPATERFQTYWVQIRLQPGRWHGWPSRLLLRSHGREVEIGAFLNEAEREELALRLSEMLAAAKRPSPTSTE
jgi:uncharacterized membrane protein